MTALHGFLGLPSDWDLIPATAAADKVNWLPVLSSLQGGPGDPALPSLGERLNEISAPGSQTLIGYSMGGRVALHMLLGPGGRRWKRAIIVSASPGLNHPAERMPRLENDGQWARRFRHEPWDQVIAAWNAQPVFATDGICPMARPESEFDREQLWLALLRGSVARQADLRSRLAELTIPVLWIAGAADSKYAALATECAGLNPLFSSLIIANAGHRVPWTANAAFSNAVARFSCELRGG